MKICQEFIFVKLPWYTFDYWCYARLPTNILLLNFMFTCWLIVLMETIVADKCGLQKSFAKISSRQGIENRYPPASGSRGKI